MKRIKLILGVVFVISFMFTGCMSSKNTTSYYKKTINKGYNFDKARNKAVSARKPRNENFYLSGVKKEKNVISTAAIVYPWDCPSFGTGFRAYHKMLKKK